MTAAAKNIETAATPHKPLFDSRELYNVYRVKIRLIDKLCGGMPKNPELLKGWIAATTEKNDETTTAQEKEAREALLEPTEEKSWNTFPADEQGGLFIWARQVKALFKECASMLRITTTKIGSKQILQHGFEVKGTVKYDRIYLGKTKPDGYDEGPIHVQTAQGPRTAIKRVDYVENVELEFEVWVLSTGSAEKRHIGNDEMVKLLTFSQENGLGADRSQGRGKLEVLEFEQVKKSPPVGGEPKAKPEKGKKDGKAAPAAAVEDDGEE